MRLDSLYVAYWSLKDPLTLSQALPVVAALAARGYRMGLMTFEQPPWALRGEERERTTQALAAQGMRWLPRPYHKSPRILGTLFDVALGARLSRQLAPRLLHGRGSVAAAVAFGASRACSALFFNDADGPLSEEYVDAGLWPRGSMGHRLTARAEGRFLDAADANAVLTTFRAAEVASPRRALPVVLPCAVDTAHFAPRPEEGLRWRKELGLRETVLVYAGKIGGWYLVEAMMDFVAAYAAGGSPVSLLVLTTGAPLEFSRLAEARGVHCVVKQADRASMPGYLSAADAGLSFVLPAPSKLACSPVKNGEYLSCGLPLVTTDRIGDYSDLVARDRLGVVATGLDPVSLASAANELRGLLPEPGLGERCREAARRHLGLEEVVLPKYFDLYRHLLGEPEEGTS